MSAELSPLLFGGHVPVRMSVRARVHTTALASRLTRNPNRCHAVADVGDSFIVHHLNQSSNEAGKES